MLQASSLVSNSVGLASRSSTKKVTVFPDTVADGNVVDATEALNSTATDTPVDGHGTVELLLEARICSRASAKRHNDVHMRT